MTDLEDLIGTLTSKEVRIIRSYIGALGSRGAQYTESLKMFNYLLDLKKKNKTLSEKELRQTKVIRSRLKTKILDALTAEVNISRPKEFEEVDHQSFRCMNKLLQIHYLYRTKGSIPIVHDLIDQVERTAKKFELFYLLTHVLMLKKYMLAYKEGLSVIKKVNEEIIHYTKFGFYSYRSNDLYYEYILNETFQKKSKETKINFLNKSIQELNELYQSSKLYGVLYYLLTLRFALYEELRDFTKARKISMLLIKLVSENNSIRRRIRIGSQYTHRSIIEFHLGNVGKAVEYMNKAILHNKPGTTNWVLYKEMVFRFYFLSNKIEKAKKTLTEALDQASVRKIGQYRFDQLKYDCANSLFAQSKYQEALIILRQKLSIRRDPIYDFYTKILTLMCHIESKDLDSAIHFAEDLKKFVYRKKKRQLIFPRHELIGKLILKYLQYYFGEKKTFSTSQEEIKLLKSKDEKYEWDKFGPELIPFHDWIQSKYLKKVKRQPA